jgi:CheY-like chemotaxis protein
MGSAVGEKAIELIVGPVPAGAMLLNGDALRLEQVLINLVSNAIKFTEAGEVALTVSVVDAQPGRVDLRFAIRDTGIGIPVEKQEEIFSAFSQADHSTTRRFGGTGLGLTITKRIVTLMGGSIGVVSAPGKGSEFSFVVPLTLDEEGGRLSPPTLAVQRVLIADDHPDALTILAEVARGMGWSTATASSGDDAVLQTLAAVDGGTPFDVLLLDWKMPGTDGLAAAGRLRHALGERQPPAIIMVTAHDREDLMRRADAGLLDAILSKPVTASAMYNAVGQARSKWAGQQEDGIGRREGARLAGLSILVADDSDINCEVARRILENEGARVLLAADGGQVLETLRATPDGVHIVLMDVQMPVIDGYEATRQIRDVLHLTDLPVVALTAGVFEDQQAAALEAGMNDFVPKPFDVDHLIATVLRLTGRPPRTASTANSAETASAIDVERGQFNWSDNVDYHKYLRRFAATHASDAEKIAGLLTQGRREDAAALVHGLKGVAGIMALTTVWRDADSVERALAQGKDSGLQVRDLLRALQVALSAIAIDTEPEKAATGEVVPGEVSDVHSLDELLRALDRDNPDEAEPILNGLASRLPPDRLAALRDRLEAFDFRGAETVARAFVARSVVDPVEPPR